MKEYEILGISPDEIGKVVLGKRADFLQEKYQEKLNENDQSLITNNRMVMKEQELYKKGYDMYVGLKSRGWKTDDYQDAYNEYMKYQVEKEARNQIAHQEAQQRYEEVYQALLKYDALKIDPLALENSPENERAAKLKRKYYATAQEVHPDKNVGNSEEATEKFKKVGQAYDELLTKPYQEQLRSHAETCNAALEKQFEEKTKAVLEAAFTADSKNGYAYDTDKEYQTYCKNNEGSNDQKKSDINETYEKEIKSAESKWTVGKWLALPTLGISLIVGWFAKDSQIKKAEEKKNADLLKIPKQKLLEKWKNDKGWNEESWKKHIYPEKHKAFCNDVLNAEKGISDDNKVAAREQINNLEKNLDAGIQANNDLAENPVQYLRAGKSVKDIQDMMKSTLDGNNKAEGNAVRTHFDASAPFLIEASKLNP